MILSTLYLSFSIESSPLTFEIFSFILLLISSSLLFPVLSLSLLFKSLIIIRVCVDLLYHSSHSIHSMVFEVFVGIVAKEDGCGEEDNF